MERYRNTIGIDISKGWLDWCAVDGSGSPLGSGRVANDARGLGRMAREASRACGGLGGALFCAEHTGVYGRPLRLWAASRPGTRLWMAHPADVKRRTGTARGKSDRLDARRIALYAFRFQDEARLWVPEPALLEALRHVAALRARLVSGLQRLSVPLAELGAFDRGSAGLLSGLQARTAKALRADLAAIDACVDALVARDPSAAANLALARSVPGVGRQTALAILLATRNFTLMDDPRRLACYAGVAPFPRSSGSSLRGRDRVSRMADRRLKSLLTLAALTAKRCDPEIRAYAERKLAEGKHAMSVVNAVRFKLICRVLAAVRRGTPYLVRPAA